MPDLTCETEWAIKAHQARLPLIPGLGQSEPVRCTFFAMIRISRLSHKRTTHTYTNITKMRKPSPGQAQKNVSSPSNLIFFQSTLKQTKNGSNQSASLVVQTVKNPLSMWETSVQSLDWEDPLETRMATHSSILAWRFPWIEKPGRLQSMGFQTVGHH